MVFSKPVSPRQTILFLVTLLSVIQSSFTAPTADLGTAVNGAPNPSLNITPDRRNPVRKNEDLFSTAPGLGKSIENRGLDVVPRGIASPETSRQPRNPVRSPLEPTPKHLGKRQTRPRSFSAPAALGSPPDAPNTNAEQDAIGAAAEKIKKAADDAVNHMEKVANAAVRNAADEQKNGIDNPSFHGSIDNSYLWPSASPVQPAWPSSGASPWNPLASGAANAAAVPDNQGQGLQVLDGVGNPIEGNALQPQRMVDGTEQYFDPTLFNEPAPAGEFQVLDGQGNPVRDNALQPQSVVPGAEQYFDPALFDEPAPEAASEFQVLDGTGAPIQNNALQPNPTVPGVEQYYDPTLFDEPLQVLNGEGNPIQNNALQPQRLVPGSEQYFDPTLFNEPDLQVLDGTGSPIQNGALQPKPTVPGAEQYYDPTLFEEPLQVLDGEGNPIQNNALQPNRVIDPSGSEQYFDPTLFNEPETPNEGQIVSDVSQTQPGQTIQNADQSVIPAIVSAPDLWRQVLDDPNIQTFLRDNTPEGLQPLLDPATKRQLEDNPSIANTLVPSLKNPTPQSLSPFLSFMDNLPLSQQLDLINEGPNIAGLAQTDPTELASVIDTIDNLRGPTPAPPVPATGFATDFLPPPSVHRDTGSGPFTPNEFEMSPVGPFGPHLLPQLDGVNQNFDGTISQPSGANQDIFGGTFGSIPTNVFLPNGGTISFNCVPIYIDANGNQLTASDVPSQILNAFNIGAMPTPPDAPSSFKDQTTDPNAPLTPLLSKVVSENPDIISASQVDDNTVLVNTKGGDDAEQVVSKLDNDWYMRAEATGNQGLNNIVLENGDTKFEVNKPDGFATTDILNANTPSDILGKAFNEGASVQLKTANVAPIPAL